ncbi:MAG TPA: DUF5664 domain-containing protein [Candidatus Cloacimonadota bacterium]|nr:DUF5664 domain-containing protein [Candidatus Cloacimonadota bacterium]HPK40065.1 DUF5664 domain-containing protein [Candidatus Cloacimonadota bacterium]
METEQKQPTIEDVIIKPIKDSGKRYTNEHGGMRDTDEDKPKFKYIDSEFLSKLLELYKAQHVERYVTYYVTYKILTQHVYNAEADTKSEYDKLIITAKSLLYFNFDSFYEGLTAFALFMEAGAKKYSFENWKLLNTPEDIERFKESCLRHYVQWQVGQQDENHLLATVFNLMALFYHTRKQEESRNNERI